METLEEIKAKARQKVEAEITNTDTYTGQIGMMLLTWIDYTDNAAELILADDKTVIGAFEAMRDYASKHKEGNFACLVPPKAMEIVLEYFGQPDPQSVIEGGLMYKAMMDATAKFKPYGTEPPESGTVTTPSEQNPQPVAEKQQPAANLSALNALNLEDLGL